MMKVRIVLLCTLLVLLAAPSFAAPPCMACVYFFNECFNDPYSGIRCRYTTTGCEEYFGYCIGRSQAPVLSEWKVSSIEIERPSLDSKSVTAPAQVAETRTAPEPAERQ